MGLIDAADASFFVECDGSSCNKKMDLSHEEVFKNVE